MQPLSANLVTSMLLLSAELHGSFGFLLARWRAALRQTAAAQAQQLGLRLDQLAVLSMCRLPNPMPALRQKDLARVAEHVGIAAASLEALLAEIDPIINLNVLLDE